MITIDRNQCWVIGFHLFPLGGYVVYFASPVGIILPGLVSSVLPTL
jgi:hypothetical protein